MEPVAGIEPDVAAVRAAVADIEPPTLRSRVEAHLAGRSMGAGRLVRHAAADAGHDRPLDDRIAGVQLIYEGLVLMRSLARDPPWVDGVRNEGDLDVLIAEVLVAKGFSLLAATAAAPTAVETVRTLGRTETARRELHDGPDSRPSLEADIYELGIMAGASATSDSTCDVANVARRVADRLVEADDAEAGAFAAEWRRDRPREVD